MKKRLMMGMLAVALVFGFALAGCDNTSGGGDGGSTGTGTGGTGTGTGGTGTGNESSALVGRWMRGSTPLVIYENGTGYVGSSSITFTWSVSGSRLSCTVTGGTTAGRSGSVAYSVTETTLTFSNPQGDAAVGDFLFAMSPLTKSQ
jgi:hypothetical protein